MLAHLPAWLLAIVIFSGVLCQDGPALRQKVTQEYRRGNDLMWCCLTSEEMDKCRAFARATEKDHEKEASPENYIFGSYYRKIRSVTDDPR